jgi:GNAT superfamily N-acetyltransferase
MCFEAVYEPNLRLELAEKTAIVRNGIAVWMYVDGAIAGETYGISPAKIDDDIEDLRGADPSVMYCYSTTVLPAFQRRRLSKVLCAYWLGAVKQAGYRLVAGHATSPAMIAVKAYFGASFSAVHERWYGTERTATFYELTL